MAEEEVVEESGYQCSCGLIIPDRYKFTGHIMRASLQEGKGTHRSLGWVGPKDKKEGKSKAKRDGQREGDDGKVYQAGNLNDAQFLRVVPKVYTIDYSPIMRAAQEAATRYWGWRPNMPLDNFIDTCLYHFFVEKGITLCGYVVDETLLETWQEEAQEVPHGS